MDVPVHEKIIWHACELARKRAGNTLVDDPRKYFPLLARGNFILDFRQSSLLFDVIDRSGPRGRLAQVLRRLFIHNTESLYETMANKWGADSGLLQSAKQTMKDALHLDDFGSYNAADHFDVVSDKDDFAKEELKHFSKSAAGRGKTLDGMIGFTLRSRLGTSLQSETGNTRDWFCMSRFGEVIHTVADFFAHTNYVELLLWSLAFSDELEPHIVLSFNDIPDVPPGTPRRCRCPLPKRGEVDPLTKAGAMFFYGAEPAGTPLVSTVFSFTDTAQSLLTRYAEHLLLLQDELSPTEYADDLNEQMDLVMALFNFSQSPILGAVRSIYVDAKSWLREKGKEVRAFLASQLMKIASASGAVWREKLELAARIVGGVDNAAMAKWGQSNEYRYVAYALERTLANELDYSKVSFANRVFKLPHHSLLRKDANKADIVGMPGTTELVRFRLGCLLAVELSARLIQWRFSSDTPERDGAMTVIDSWMRHPCKQLDPANIGKPNRLRVSGYVTKVALCDWPLLTGELLDEPLEVV